MSELIPVITSVNDRKKTIIFGRKPQSVTDNYKNKIDNYSDIFKRISDMFIDGDSETEYTIKFSERGRNITGKEEDIRREIKEHLEKLAKQADTAELFQTVVKEGDDIKHFLPSKGEAVALIGEEHYEDSTDEGSEGDGDIEELEKEKAILEQQLKLRQNEIDILKEHRGGKVDDEEEAMIAQREELRRVEQEEEALAVEKAGAGAAVSSEPLKKDAETQSQKPLKRTLPTQTITPTKEGGVQTEVETISRIRRPLRKRQGEVQEELPLVELPQVERQHEDPEDIIPPTEQIKAQRLLMERAAEGGAGGPKRRPVSPISSVIGIGAPPIIAGGAGDPAGGGVPGGDGGLLPEDAAKEALKNNQFGGVNVALIGADSAKEMKEAGIIYKDSFRIVFTDRSGVRELRLLRESEDGEAEERKDPDTLYAEAEEIREAYHDQMKVERLVFNETAPMEDLIQQKLEMMVLKSGIISNLTSGKSGSDPLKDFDGVGVVVDISSMGLSLEDFLEYAKMRGLSGANGDAIGTHGTSRLTGLKKPQNIEDVRVESKQESEETVPRLPGKLEDLPQKKILGKTDYITNEKIRGRSNIAGLRGPVKVETRRLRINL